MKCLTPYFLRTAKYWSDISVRYLPAPCGHCIACRLRNRLIWTFRIEEEVKDNVYTAFATLTYSEAFRSRFTINVKTDDGLVVEDVPSIPYDDLQAFNDRFKKRLKYKFGISLRWFCVGEYGGETNRPHFHCLYFFNHPNRDVVNNNVAFFPSVFRDCWPYGSILDFQQIQGVGAAGYCNKYISNNWNDKLFGDQTPSKSLKSQLIGRGYIDRMKAWHLADPDNRLYVPYNGKKIPLPRTFLYKIFGLSKDKKSALEIERLYSDMLAREFVNIRLAKENGSTYDLHPFYSPDDLIDDSIHYYKDKFTKKDKM